MKKMLFGFILGGIIFGSIVYAANYYAENVSYKPDDENWNVSNVNDAIDSLHKTSKEINEEYLKAINTGHIVAVYSGCQNTTAWLTASPIYVDSQLGTLSDNVYTLKYGGTYKLYFFATSTDYDNHSGKGNTGAGKLLVNGAEVFSKSFTNALSVQETYTMNAGDQVILQTYGGGYYCTHINGVLYKVD